MQIGLVHSKVPLKEFDHSNCKTEGWAEQVWGLKSVLLSRNCPCGVLNH